MRWVLMAIVAWAAASVQSSRCEAQTSQPAPAGPLELKLTNARWQTLPPQVRMVFIGPDQRLWLVTGGPMAAGIQAAVRHLPEDQRERVIAGIHAQVQQQWAKPSPVLTDTWPVLFERSGRVWFLTPDRQVLLGYDGKSWVQEPAHRPGMKAIGYIGRCPGHGRPSLRPWNVDLGTTQLFAEETGITVFDGKSFSFQPFSDDLKIRWYGIIAMWREFDGKGAVALGTGPVALWRYRDGKWTHITVADSTRAIHGVALGGDGSLYVDQFDALRDLRSAWTLKVDAPAGQPALRLNDLDVSQHMPMLSDDSQGNVYVAVHNLRPPFTARAGTFIIARDGKMRFVPELRLEQELWSVAPSPLFDGRGKAWLGHFYDGVGAKVVDLSAEAPKLTPLGNPSARFVQAIDADGRVFLSASDPLDGPAHLAGSTAPMLVYKP